jgi:hypothetical protein
LDECIERFEPDATVHIDAELQACRSGRTCRVPLDVEVPGCNIGAFDASRRSRRGEAILVGALLVNAGESRDGDLLKARGVWQFI